jgi:hypothetical protein
MAEDPIDRDPARDRPGGAKAAEYRRRAQVHEQEAITTPNTQLRELQLRLARSYLALAENEEWLSGHMPPDRLA